MSRKPYGFAGSRTLRAFIVIFGCIAISWGVTTFPLFWREASIERIASRIAAGEPYKIETLTAQIPIIEGIEKSAYCHASALRAAAIIRLRIAETIVSASSETDERLRLLGNVIRGSLSCAPADPFLWLVLYWTASRETGAAPDNLKYIRMSYLLGPNEGWIGLKRNYVAFAIFEQLPPDLAERAIDEFIGLMKTGRLYRQVAEIFTGPGWHVRDAILRRLQARDDWRREPFVYEVRRLGRDVDLPRTN